MVVAQNLRASKIQRHTAPGSIDPAWMAVMAIGAAVSVVRDWLTRSRPTVKAHKVNGTWAIRNLINRSRCHDEVMFLLATEVYKVGPSHG